MLHTRAGLLGAETQGGDEAEHGSEYRENIDHVSRPAPDALTQQRIEDRTHTQRQALVE